MARTKDSGKKKALRKGPETEVTTEVLDFIKTLDEFKKVKNRPFPTWSEVLEVLKCMGYRQVDEPKPVASIGSGDHAQSKTQSKEKRK